jgi:hypothetical protein
VITGLNLMAGGGAGGDACAPFVGHGLPVGHSRFVRSRFLACHGAFIGAPGESTDRICLVWR